jgi:hypothetical protein
LRRRGIINGRRSASAIFAIIDEIEPIKRSSYESEK